MSAHAKRVCYEHNLLIFIFAKQPVYFTCVSHSGELKTFLPKELENLRKPMNRVINQCYLTL